MDKKYLYMEKSKKIVEDFIIAIEQLLLKQHAELSKEDIQLLKKAIKALKNVLKDAEEKKINNLLKNPVVQMTILKLLDWLMK